MMLNNDVGILTAYINTKANVIADQLSRIKRDTNSLRCFRSLVQDFPALAGCRRFLPSAELISHIMDAISQRKLINPLTVSACIRRNPGQFTFSNGVTA
jgi:hypothetical protein